MRVAEERPRGKVAVGIEANTAASASARSICLPGSGVPTSWAHADEMRPSAIRPVTTERSTSFLAMGFLPLFIRIGPTCRHDLVSASGRRP